MKSKTDDYDDILIVWETIWSVSALYSSENEIRSESQQSRGQGKPSDNTEECPASNGNTDNCFEEKNDDDQSTTPRSSDQTTHTGHNNGSIKSLDDRIIDHPGHFFTSDIEEEFTNLKSKPSSFNTDKDSMAELAEKLSQRLNMDDLETYSLNQGAHSLEFGEPHINCPKLKNVELFCLCICLAIIRRERDLILANELEASEILKVSHPGSSLADFRFSLLC